MQQAAILVFDGCEPIEAFTVVDVLSRTGLFEITILGLPDTPTITTAHGITVSPHRTLAQVAEITYDLIVIPGGPAATKEKFYMDQDIHTFIQRHHERNRTVAAICAAPLVLGHAGILENKPATCYPALKEKLLPLCRSYSEDKVVRTGNVITSRGPGTALLFALSIVKALVSCEEAVKIGKDMLVSGQDLDDLRCA
ncbi:hypothetical protein P9112_010674 [Eukaryota sp. TZLM1-RC]